MNIFNASALLGDINGTGRDFNRRTNRKVNTAIKDADFQKPLKKTTPLKLWLALSNHVKHPDSDHLSITQTEVDNGEILQIVCGAPNIKAGQK